MHFRTIAIAVFTLLVAHSGLTLADTTANPNDNQLVMRSDGFIYLVTNGIRHLVVPVSLSDDEITAMPEGEPYLDGLSPMTSVAGGAALANVAQQPTPTPTPSSVVQPGPVKVALGDYSIDASPSPVKAGKITFNVENDGKVRHEFIVFRSDLDTASLPANNGRVNENGVGKKIGEVEALKAGDVQATTFELEAGRYILLCNLSGHYAKGMVSALDVK